jgi:hypothetical protein
MLPGQSNQLVQFQVAEASVVSVTETMIKIARLERQHELDPAIPGGRVCEWCCNFFDYRPRPLGEVERLQQTLHITGPAVARVPVCCDGCYESVTTSALRNEHVMDGVGVSNSGHPNLTLRMQKRGA